MNRFRQWWSEEYSKVRGLSPRSRARYIWAYYKLWIIGIGLALFVLIWGIHQYRTGETQVWFFACFANTTERLGEGSQFWKDYADFAGYDLKEKELVFNAQMYFDPVGKTAGNQYYQLLIAYMDSGTLDVLVMDPEDLRSIGASGRLMDLEDERVRAIMDSYPDRLVYCEPIDEEYGKDQVAVGIDLFGTVLTDESGAYPEGAALGINALAPHPEEAAVFLRFLLGNEQ